jgi:conjugal transfer/entry exclusion protein
MEHFNEGLIEMDNIIESNLKDIAKIKWLPGVSETIKKLLKQIDRAQKIKKDIQKLFDAMKQLAHIVAKEDGFLSE